jgi:cysteine sulfinate desulfinase/cysteine desulfurase-like protein
MKPDEAASRQTIRFSLGPQNTPADVSAALEATCRATMALRS